MPFTGDEKHRIGLSEAAQLTAGYRQSAETDAILGFFFGKTALANVLKQDGCVGIRIYYAIKDGQPNLVLVGVSADGEDLQDGYILELALPCPPFCPVSSELNGTA
jgi:hypothetical protein